MVFRFRQPHTVFHRPRTDLHLTRTDRRLPLQSTVCPRSEDIHLAWLESSSATYAREPRSLSTTRLRVPLRTRRHPTHTPLRPTRTPLLPSHRSRLLTRTLLLLSLTLLLLFPLSHLLTLTLLRLIRTPLRLTPTLLLLTLTPHRPSRLTPSLLPRYLTRTPRTLPSPSRPRRTESPLSPAIVLLPLFTEPPLHPSTLLAPSGPQHQSTTLQLRSTLPHDQFTDHPTTTTEKGRHRITRDSKSFHTICVNNLFMRLSEILHQTLINNC